MNDETVAIQWCMEVQQTEKDKKIRCFWSWYWDWCTLFESPCNIHRAGSEHTVDN